MTAAPLPGRFPASAGPRRSHGRLARFAVVCSAVAGAALATSVALFGIFYATGVDAEDNWLAGILTLGLAVGVLGSLMAFLLAFVGRIWVEKWAWRWLPFCVFPAIMTFLVLGEAFLWE